MVPDDGSKQPPVPTWAYMLYAYVASLSSPEMYRKMIFSCTILQSKGLAESATYPSKLSGRPLTYIPVDGHVFL